MPGNDVLACPLPASELLHLMVHGRLGISRLYGQNLGQYEQVWLMPYGSEYEVTIETCGINQADLIALGDRLVAEYAPKLIESDLRDDGWLFDDKTTEQIGGKANIKETKEQRGARLLEWYEEEEAIKKRGSYNRVTERESKRTGKKEDRSNLSKLIKKTRIDLQNQAKKDRLNNPVLPTSNSPFGYLDRGNNN
jgi:hypothetical protein